MERTVGTTVRGVRTPIVKEGDDLVNIVVESVLNSAKIEGYKLNDRDVIGITESLVARAQGNYAYIDDITYDVNRKFNGESIAVIFPILSRNRFFNILKGIISTKKKIYLFLNYPSDEVGNCLMDIDKLDEIDINPYRDVLSEEEYRKIFGEKVLHPFTAMDYVHEYKNLAIDDNVEIYLANDPKAALKYTKDILVASIHNRDRIKRILKKSGAETVYGLDEILNEPIDGSGFNPEFGLLGSNKASENRIKLFPRDCQDIVEKIQKEIKNKTGKQIEVMVYGDGAFKDPIGKIWEMADPVTSPGYTMGLKGTPNEIKLKYIADNEFSSLKSDDMAEAMKKKIKEKENNLLGKDDSLGTTPRRITDLLGSLCDLTSGSGDKGTPVVLVQGYFDNYAAE